MTAFPEPDSFVHPYARLPPSRFWKSAIADIDFSQLNGIWQPRFPIGESTSIVTAGSCFAQHIGDALRLHGFNWIEAEPAPVDLPTDQHAVQGYGIFSFRLGNIYTAGLLAQWLRWASGHAMPPDEVFVEGNRFFDPFRPRIPADGYPTPDAVREARATSLAAMARMLAHTELFIFTLGLTEAWRNRNGDIYPMCPGTVRGTFNPVEHVFHNFSQDEVMRDLEDAIVLLHDFNPTMKFLLTVSPVPLTATATPQHVLAATTYSKAVLRAAAGELYARRNDLDYFPSYELIASPPARGRYFETNERTVRRDGVNFVMAHFLSGLRSVTAEKLPTSAPPYPSPITGPAELAACNEICDDLVLETYSRSVATARHVAPPNLYLIGDSQMGMLARVLDEDGIRYAGGAIMHASEWLNNRFTLSSDGMFFHPTHERSQAIWASTGAMLRQHLARDNDKPALIITNIGAQASQMLVGDENGLSLFESMMRDAYPSGRPAGLPTITAMSLLSCVRLQHIQLLRRFVDTGIPVVWVSDPPTQLHLGELFAAFDTILTTFAANAGCIVINAREWMSAMGGLPESFRSTESDPVTGLTDWLHAAPAYYRALFRRICSERGFVPQQADQVVSGQEVVG